MMETVSRDDSDYIALRNNLIKQFEGQVLWIYTDDKGYPTIGWGFNIDGDENLRNAVYTALNIPTGEEGEDLRGALDSAIEDYSTPNQTAETNPLKTQLDGILASYAPDLLEAGFTIQPTFDLTEAQIVTVFNSGTTAREDALDLWLGGTSVDVGQRAALFSLAWNNYIRADGTGSPSLKSALTRGDRAEAWYEIRYNMPDGNHGRHFAEAQVFGLYSDPINVSDAEAEQVLHMYLTHKNDILFKNSDVAGTYTNANAYLNNANAVSYITGQEKADTLGQILKPIANYILQNYTPAEVQSLGLSGAGFSGDVVLGFETQHSSDKETFIQPVYRAIYDKSPLDESNLPEGVTGINDLLVGINGKSYSMQGLYGNDMIIGADMNDVLYGGYKEDRKNSGNDTLIGGGGDDKLYGQDGNDVLIGGTGNDTYIFEGNFGTDIIKDSDGNGSISITGWSGGFTSVQGSDIIFRDAGNKFEAIKINNGSTTDLLITSLTDEATGNILIKDWNSGGLGISLTVGATTTPGIGAGTVNGDGGNNAITLDNLRDNNPTLDLSTFTALYADGGSGNDIIMGTLNGNDTLLGGDGDDIISGGFTSTLGSNASSTFQSGAGSSGVDSIDGGAGNDFIFAAAGGSIAHGGSGNDVLLAKGPAYFQFNNLAEVLADEANGIAGHRAIKRDEVYADAITRMNFGVVKNGLNYQLNHNYFTDFTSSYTEYNSAIEGVKFIGRSGGATSSHSNGDVSYSFAGSYSLTYDYSNSDDELNPVDEGNPPPASMSVSIFAPGSGKNLDDLANVKGANLFGDEGDDYLGGGIFADYLSGGADNDTVFAGAGNDIIDGGTGNDELHGEEGRDIIIGGDGDDTLVGGDGNDLLIGGEGSDRFSGGEGDDTIVGDVTDKFFSGGGGNNIFIIEDIVFEQVDLPTTSGGANNDTLSYVALSSQTNTQVSSSSASLLTIDSPEGNNTLALVGVSSLDQITLTAQNNDLVLHTGNAAIFVRDGLSGTVGHLALGNSADEFTGSATSARSTTIDDVILARLITEVIRTAQSSGTQLVGGLLGDSLTAHSGGSILIGGQGDDALIGGIGDDTYVIRAGDGVDSITEQGGNNTIKLMAGINPDDLTLRRIDNNLLVIISGSQSVVVNGMFNEDSGELVSDKAIHRIEFNGGEVWDLARVLQESEKGVALIGGDFNDALSGYASNDTLTGGKGNDTLRGGKGDDHYHFAIGDGADRIDDNGGNDHIYFADGISEAQVTLRKDTGNNLIIRINNSDSIKVLNAFNPAGELTSQAIEQIHFNSSTVWDLDRIQTEIAKNQSHAFIGTSGNDELVGDNASQIFNGAEGDDQLTGGNADDVYQYALGDGRDVITDTNGNDRLELLAGINESEVIARRNGDDLVLTMKDGGSITIQNTFGVKAANVVDPVITALIEQLQNYWISQAESLIEQHYGLTGSGDITLRFENGVEGVEAAHVEATYSGPNGVGTDLQLVIDLSDFGDLPNGGSPYYYDRIIAHEMVHAIMARNMNNPQLPGWFTEGTAELIHGADERVKADAEILSIESNFNALFKTTPGSPSLAAGYSVSYIAVKLLDKEIRDNGGLGIREIFDQLKTGKTLDQSLAVVSAAHPELATMWNSLSTFESHFITVGFSQYTQLLTLDDADTGSIAGSDYGHSPLTASTVISDVSTGPSKQFNLIIPEEYIATPEINGVLETIIFSSGNEWNFSNIKQEVLKPTNGNDTIHAFDTDDYIEGGQGDDSLVGEGGNDTYYYQLGDGKDTILDKAGMDSIVFLSGVRSTDIKINKSNIKDIVISISDGGKITIKNALDDSGNFSDGFIESIVFSDEVTWNPHKIKSELEKTPSLVLVGTVLADTLPGSSGDDLFYGGKGNDNLIGGAGKDRYIYNLGDGSDTIINSSGPDEIEFGIGINPKEVSIFRNGPDLQIRVTPTETIVIKNMFVSTTGQITGMGIEKIIFASGETFDLPMLLQRSLTATRDGSVLAAYNSDDLLLGDIGNDTLNGLAGADTLIGGKGNDLLAGDSGDDTYIYNLGFGADRVFDTGGNDKLVFGKGIAPENISVSIAAGFFAESPLIIRFTDGGSIEIPSLVNVSTGAKNTSRIIESFQFYDGRVLSLDEIIAISFSGSNKPEAIYGLSSNDTLVGGGGGDLLSGGLGNDTYIYNLGDGADTIVDSGGVDTIVFGENIESEDIKIFKIPVVSTSGTAVTATDGIPSGTYVPQDTSVKEVSSTHYNFLVLLEDGDYIYIESYSPNNPIEVIKFFSGEVWDADTINNNSTIPSNSSDVIIGSNTYDSLTMGAGEAGLMIGLDEGDYLKGGAGDDVLVSAANNDIYGADILKGGGGADTFKIMSSYSTTKAQTQIIRGFDSDDVIKFDSTISPDDVKVSLGVRPLSRYLINGNVEGFSYIGMPISGWTISIKTPYFEVELDNILGTSLAGANPIPASAFGRIEFSDGTIWDGSDIIQRMSQTDISDNELFGYSSSDVLNGSDGNDSIYGYAGNDVIDGGKGNDTLVGGPGNDIYKFELGGGIDRIIESDSGDVDSIEFGAGIELSHLKLKRIDGNFQISLNAKDKITIIGAFNAGSAIFNKISMVEQIVFASGDSLSQAEIYSLYQSLGDSDYVEIPPILNSSISNTGNLIKGFSNPFYRVHAIDFVSGDVIGDAFSDSSGAYVINLQSEKINGESLVVESFDLLGNKVAKNELIAPDHGPDISVAFNAGGNTIIGSTELGATVIVKRGNSSLAAPIVQVDDNGQFSVSLSSNYLNGQAFDIVAIDSFGNENIKRIFAPDTTSPSIGAPKLSTSGNLITGTAEAGSIIEAFDVLGVRVGTSIADVDTGAYLMALDFTYLNKEKLQVVATDSAGNKSKIVTITASDKTPPATPSATLDSTRKIITGTAEPGSTVEVRNAAGSVLRAATANTTSGNYSITLITVLAIGESVTITARDAASNISQPTVLTATGNMPLPKVHSANFDSIGKTVSGTAEAGNTIVVKNADGLQLKTTVAGTNGSYSLTLDTALINNEVVYVTAKDTSGNISEAKTIIAPDKTAPLVPEAEFDATGKIIAGITEGGSTVIVKDAIGTLIGTAVADATTGAYTVTLPTALINNQTVNVTSTDDAGNVSLVRTIVAPDLTPPEIPTATFDAGGEIITGVAEANSAVIIKNASGDELGRATADELNGTYSVTLLSALIDKETVNVTAMDGAGNVSGIQVLIAPDKTSPVAPTANLNVTTKEVNGVAEAGSSVIVTDSTGQTLGTAQADITTGAYTVSLTQALIDGQSIFTTAIDAAGNISPATSTPIVIPANPQPIANGLRGSFYGYHQPASGNVNLTNVAQVLGIIASKAPDATFVATRIQYTSSASLGMGTNLQTFLNVDASSLSGDPTDSSDAIIRFDGKIQLDAGNYNFRVRADDGYSLRINGVVVAEHNANQGVTTRTHATFTVGQSGLQDIEIIYWDANGGNALNVELRSAATGVYSYLDESILFQSAANPETVALVSESSFTESTHYFNTNDALIQAMATFAPYSGVANHYRAAYSEQHIMTIAANS